MLGLTHVAQPSWFSNQAAIQRVRELTLRGRQRCRPPQERDDALLPRPALPLIPLFSSLLQKVIVIVLVRHILQANCLKMMMIMIVAMVPSVSLERTKKG